MESQYNLAPSNPSREIIQSQKAIQNFYMIAEKNHMQLSGLADKKANIILAVCALIISAVLTGSSKVFKQDFEHYIFIPTAIFLFFMVLTMILSIITTMPKLSTGVFKLDDVKNHKVNLAFFGNFHKMKLEDYEWAVSYMREDTAEVYKMLTTDLYFLGSVLDKKFRLLNYTYILLVIGVVISIFSFITAYYLRYYAT